MRNRLSSMTTQSSQIVSCAKYYVLCLSITKLMSSKRGRIRNKPPTATPPDITYTDPVNCQWATCGQRFSFIYDLVQHIKKTHILKRTTKDNVCLWRNCWRNRKPFKNQSGLVTHLRSHSGENPYRCPVSPPTVTTCVNQ